MNKLAIVIPFYKIEYFKELLDSLKNQTDKRFNLYIGDDNSPNNPIDIIDNSSLEIKYKCFDTNLGKINLVAQWHRCIDMIEDEEWIWVLPDDDLPSNNVVEEFYRVYNLENNKIKVIQLRLNIIDKNSKIISWQKEKSVEFEDNLSFYTKVVKGEYSCSLGDNIFHRKSLMDSGGFVSFNKAWLSDHATVLISSKNGYIYYINNAILSFRMSGINISSDKSDGVDKLKSRINFFLWLKLNENIFPKRPQKDFYKFLYFKAEYYILNEWNFNIRMFYYLYKLRILVINSYNVIPILSILVKRIFK